MLKRAYNTWFVQGTYFCHTIAQFDAGKMIHSVLLGSWAKLLSMKQVVKHQVREAWLSSLQTSWSLKVWKAKKWSGTGLVAMGLEAEYQFKRLWLLKWHNRNTNITVYLTKPFWKPVTLYVILLQNCNTVYIHTCIKTRNITCLLHPIENKIGIINKLFGLLDVKHSIPLPPISTSPNFV